MNIDIRNLQKWLNEEQEAPIDRQALARVLAMAEQPAQQEPVADRENAIIRFALHQFMSNAYSHMNAAAQDKDNRHYTAGAVEKFAKDAKDAEALLSRLQFKAPQPARQRHISYACPQCHWSLEEQPAQQQEPVVWNVIDPFGKIVATEKDAIRGWARIQGYKPTVESLLGFQEQGWRVVPASPPPAQRKPLSNGEIYTAYITATNQTLRPQDERLAFAFARAIEAAHGIKENT